MGFYYGTILQDYITGVLLSRKPTNKRQLCADSDVLKEREPGDLKHITHLRFASGMKSGLCICPPKTKVCAAKRGELRFSAWKGRVSSSSRWRNVEVRCVQYL